MRRKIMLASVVVLFALMASLTFISWPAAQVSKIDPKWQKFYYGGCGLGGAAYMVAQGAGAVLREKLRLDVTVEATGCGVDNVKLVDRNEVQAGCSGVSEPYRAYRGVPPYQKKYPNLRGWYPFYVVGLQLIVLKDSPIQKLEDIRGKKISVHTKGSGSEANAYDLLHAVGLGYDVIKPHYLTYGAAAEALKAGTIDGLIWSTGIPVPQMFELGATHQYRIIDMPEKLIREKVCPVLPVYSPYTLEAEKIYGGGKGYVGPPRVGILGTYTIAEINKDVPDDLVYRMTKVIWENRKVLSRWHPSAAEMSYEMVKVMEASLPTHPGAKKFYEEAGVWSANPSPVVRPLK
jgi:TRAP transporter TAXI family solute receptor